MSQTKNHLLKASLGLVFILTWMNIVAIFVIGGLRQRVTELTEKTADMAVNMEVSKCEK